MKVNDTKKNSKNVDNPTDITTVARGPKILQNNSKGAAINIFWQRRIGGRTAPNFDQKWQKKGRKIFLVFFQGQF